MKKILLIEDDPAIREAVTEALEFADYDVEIAVDGIQGVKCAKEYQPDLILCDIMMPTLDGYGVLQKLQQEPATANIPFVFLTAKARQNDVRQGMMLGADDYITKPFTAPDLLKSISARFERHQQISEVNHQSIDETKE